MRITNKESARFVARLEPFVTNNATLRGSRGDLCTTRSGEMPDEYADIYKADIRSGHTLYVVHSYDTPIAWYTILDEWKVPGVKYSQTTSKHMSAIDLTPNM